MMKRIVLAAGLALALAACNDQSLVSSNRHLSPIPPQTVALMSQKGMSKDGPILVRLFKKEAELEVWKQASNGQYALLRTLPICRWSGQLGPKIREGDRQAPEGFYTVTPELMNPNSSYYLSFNMGFPNQFDRAHGRTGSHLMVHGSCTSRGCYAMTDEAISEVYALAREAFNGGQRGFQVQAFPFRMTAENMATVRYDRNIAFWRNLKEGYDHFEVTRAEPRVEVCGRQYAFNTQNCAPINPQVTQAVAARQVQDEMRIAEYVSRGTPAVSFVYEDGGGHPSFFEYAKAAATAEPGSRSRAARRLGDVSRVDALVAGPRMVALDPSGRPLEQVAPQPAHAFASAQPQSAPAAFPSADSPSAPSQQQQPAAVANTGEVPSTDVATSEAGQTRPLHMRLFGNLFSSEPMAKAPEQYTGQSSGQAANPTTTAPAAVPPPPRRGAERAADDRRAGIIPGAHAIIPDAAIGYTSFR
jgi:murein L,D-transpeptidase YafK